MEEQKRREIETFEVTEEELFVLAIHYANWLIEDSLSRFLFAAGISTSEAYEIRRVEERLNTIGDIIGKSRLETAWEQVETKHRKQDEQLWKVFVERDEHKSEVMLEDVQRHNANQCSCEPKEDRRHEPDWKWIHEEMVLHREGRCRIRQ